MKQKLRVALAQINCTVGDIEGNASKISEYIRKAQSIGADIVSFPELALTGYPPEDMLLKSNFIDDNLKKIKEVARAVGEIVAVVGFVDRKGKEIYNAAAVLYKGKILAVYHKMCLPNYGVFDEKRYFTPGEKSVVLKFGNILFGVNICEDVWYKNGPIQQEAFCGAKLILNINASPYHMGKIKLREHVIAGQAKANKLFMVYTNLVGGQDELVFDGQSMVLDDKGRVIQRLEAFQEDLLAVDLKISQSKGRCGKTIIKITDKLPVKEKPPLPVQKRGILEPVKEVYEALLLGLSDYVKKNGFQKVVLGLSGGIDSSLVASLAVDALGKDNVTGIFMPSRYSSAESEEDARQTVQNLGIKFIIISIEQIYKMYLAVLEQHFFGMERNIAEENLQARIRGNMLMAFSNKFGWIVLATGNKSEMSTGYATLYGDMAGGFAVIKDVPKELVYKLSRYRNSLSQVIPERVFTKEPTAELRPNQKDSDTLPAYDILDPILKAYIEEDKELEKIVALGFDKETVSKALKMVDASEYKRRQSPPGIKITPKAFGRDRRMPITNKYRG